MRGSKFCYVHSLGKVRNVPFWKNSTFHFFCSIAVALAIVLYTTYTSHKQTQTIVDKAVMIGKLDQKRLLQSYPLGYVIVTIDYSGVITPHGSRLNRECEIQWETANVVEMNERAMIFQMPDMTCEPGYSVTATTITIPRNSQGKAFRTPIGIVISDPFIQSYVEVLVDSDDGWVLVLGYRELPTSSVG